jgi:hypothetical protein
MMIHDSDDDLVMVEEEKDDIFSEVEQNPTNNDFMNVRQSEMSAKLNTNRRNMEVMQSMADKLQAPAHISQPSVSSYERATSIKFI